MINQSGIQRARSFAVLMAAVLTFMVEDRTPRLGVSNLSVGGVVSAILFGVGLFMLRNNPKAYRGALRSKNGFLMVIFGWLIFTLTAGIVGAVVAIGAPTIFAGCGLAALLFAVQLTLSFRELRSGTPPRKDVPDQL